MIVCPPEGGSTVGRRYPRHHTTLSLLMTMVAVMGSTSCTPETPSEFRIGLLAVTSPGYVESSGQPSIRGAELAAPEVNDAGGPRLSGHAIPVSVIAEAVLDPPR